MSGKVYLVGAGPGDPELLTLKALRVLAAADVVLVDDLVSRAVLVHAREDARVIHVGKRGGCKSTPQAFIERLMIAEAKAGRCVVRLKGGDPFVFGRGGEELETLERAGVRCEIVSGVTAASAAATAAGVALTDRRVTAGVIFVTAHGSGDHEPDWAALARTRMTLAVYMGVARCAQVQCALLAGGLPGSTPAVIVENASLARERQVRTTLERLAADLAAHEIRSPAVMLIGEVADAGRSAASGATRAAVPDAYGPAGRPHARTP